VLAGTVLAGSVLAGSVLAGSVLAGSAAAVRAQGELSAARLSGCPAARPRARPHVWLPASGAVAQRGEQNRAGRTDRSRSLPGGWLNN
jgi:hypothetical protein